MEKIDNASKRTESIEYISGFLPERIRNACRNYLNAYKDISELRLRLDQAISFTVAGRSMITGMKVNRDDLQYVTDHLTEGNYYKNEELMRRGYLTLDHGIRVGIAGDVFVSEGAVSNLKYVNYINIRIPSVTVCDCLKLINHIENSAYNSSILVISSPCNGKTTLLRSVCKVLSSPPHSKRLAVIDTNRELALPCGENGALAEYFSGYPKAYGINVAIKYFNPEYLICDELGEKSECEEIMASVHSGVPLIASAHAASFSDLKKKKSLALLLENGVFDTVYKIHRSELGFEAELKRVTEL